MDEEAGIILGDAIAFCQRDGRDARLINMLGQSRALSLTEDTLTIEAPSRFAIAQLMKHKAIIEAYLEEIAFAPITLEVVAPQGAASPVAASPAASVSAAASVPPTSYPTAPQPVIPSPAAMSTIAADVSRETTPTGTTNMPTAAGSEDGSATSVTVKNTLSADDFRRMMNQMKGTAPKTSVQAPKTVAKPVEEHAAEVEPDDAPSIANSKFTFENFVYGDENKHAYRSALKFAVTADEPGTCTSLFIYGNSGLGKTHLLLAVKNEIATRFPQIKVKYANSQAYIDDYINEVAIEKKSGSRIMNAYHNADVLIIDDVQNIVGKDKSLDYFFQLMDEFIRKGKKIAIASDRAPKDLNMDERITSRFNAGMLCPVSEPGYEMKLQILERYYESNIAQAEEPTDDSLLSSLRGGGVLTREHIKHMAEVSGNNIRELESFCERCAGESWDREQEGSELSFSDIDTIASEYFDSAPKKINVQTVQTVIEDEFDVTHEELVGPRRNANIAKARHIAIYLAIEMCDMTTSAVGAEFGGRNHSTVSTSYKKVQKMIQEDRGFTDDLKALRKKITLRS